jgi:putative ABC transport system ATP-binding protein
MNMIGCLDTPTSGEYYIDGQKANGLNDDQLADIRNKKIGFIFQGFNLLQKLSALENVELPLVYQGVSTKERYEKSVKALNAVGLGDRLLHKPNELSGGQQQRVAIARALASDPPLILADEPTGNLDTKSGKEIMALLHELHNRGNTIVLITHDNEVAMQADRVVRIQDGMITEDRKVV